MALLPLAEITDVEQAYRALDDAERGQAEHLLRMAQAIVRAEVPALDRRIEAGTLDPALVRDVVISVTLRALRNPENARGRSRTAGPFTEYTQFDAELVGVNLIDAERRVLAPPLRRAAGLGSIRLSAGLGFPPPGEHPDPPAWRPGSGVRL